MVKINIRYIFLIIITLILINISFAFEAVVDAHGINLSSTDAATPYKMGVRISLNRPSVQILNVTIDANDQSHHIYIYNATGTGTTVAGTIIADAAVLGGIADFSGEGVVLNNTDNYYIIAWSNGTNRNARFNNGPVFPYNRININYQNNTIDAGGGFWEKQTKFIRNITS